MGEAERQYDHKDGGYILMTPTVFATMSIEDQALYTLNERFPTDKEVAEFRAYQIFNRVWHTTIDRLEDTSRRPVTHTKKGKPVKWRYSTHDIANVITWTYDLTRERVIALEAEIEELKSKASPPWS